MSRKHFIHLAKLADQTERYEEMVENMKRAASFDQELTIEERKFFSDAYKNAIGARRVSWRIIVSIEQKEESKGNDAQVSLIKGYRERIEGELAKIIEDITGVINKHLIPSAASGESKVFYYKMMGDYYRYLAEFARDDMRLDSATKSLNAYKAGAEIAVIELPAIDPTRLALVLNFAVFYHDIINDPARACSLTKHGLDDAYAELDTVSDQGWPDSRKIMQALSNNLSEWATEMQEVPIDDEEVA